MATSLAYLSLRNISELARQGEWDAATAALLKIAASRPFIARSIAVGIDQGVDDLLDVCVADPRSVDFLKMILRFGADPNYRSGDTHILVRSIACDRSTRESTIPITEALLAAGADPNERATDTGTLGILHWAVQNARVEHVRLLLRFGADPMQPSEVGLLPMDLAAQMNNQEKRKLLENFESMDPDLWLSEIFG